MKIKVSELDLLCRFIESRKLNYESDSDIIIHDILNYISVALSFRNIICDEFIDYDENDNTKIVMLYELMDLLDNIVDDLVCG